MPNHYYNPGAASHDSRRGAGYGKSQSKLPSDSTGIGSTYTMGWETGIYPPEDDYDPTIEIPFDDYEDLRAFLSKINLGYTSSDSVKPRADRSSLGHSSNKFTTVGMGALTEQNIPIMHGMVPIPKKAKYPGSLGMAAGGSSSDFGATRTRPGQVGGTGTQFGTSRKPLPDDEDDELRFFSFVDLLDMDEDERNFLKHSKNVARTLELTESLL